MKTLKTLKKNQERIICFILFMLNGIYCAFAQTNAGLDGLNQATSMIQSYFTPAVRIIYTVAAITGIIGAYKVYNKFSGGEPDTAKTAMAWFGSMIFMIIAATVLRSFFGISG